MTGTWTPRPGARLTDHEAHILTLISEGKTNAAIGRELYVTEDTVKTQVRNIFTKLEIRDRAGAVRVGIERGLVAADSRVAVARDLLVDVLKHRAAVAAMAGDEADHVRTAAVVRVWHEAAALVQGRAAVVRAGDGS